MAFSISHKELFQTWFYLILKTNPGKLVFTSPILQMDKLKCRIMKSLLEVPIECQI